MNRFFFVHGVNGPKILDILNSGEIKLSTEIPEELQSFKGYGSDYVYCWAKFDSINVDLNVSYTSYEYSVCISPFILLKEDIIFNSFWEAIPLPEKSLSEITNLLKTKDCVPAEYYFSIHLNKNDSTKLRIKKLKIIKNVIMFRINMRNEKKFQANLCEFLIPHRVNLQSYLIGICQIDFLNETQKVMKEKYPNIKTVNITEPTTLTQFPNLIDLCPT